MLIFVCFKICYGLVLIITILLSVAFVTLFERKVMGFMQRRRGPNVVGIYGLLQPLADGIKLILKETILPLKSNSIVFFCAPVITFWLSLMG
jgi:NADH:ubiquinone oxidoreductase subunit H